MTETRDIGWRLENWARWCTARAGRGADSMTGAICESMRKAALGNVWSGHDQRDPLDDADAARIERGMRDLPIQQRLLLDWCYIQQARPEVVCRKVSIPIKEFVDRFREAQEAIEDIVDNLGNR